MSPTLPPAAAPAQIGYHAYGRRADWKNHAGLNMPSWDDLPEAQRAAWIDAATAIIESVADHLIRTVTQELLEAIGGPADEGRTVPASPIQPAQRDLETSAGLRGPAIPGLRRRLLTVAVDAPRLAAQ
jgi:hypothetical protein